MKYIYTKYGLKKDIIKLDNRRFFHWIFIFAKSRNNIYKAKHSSSLFSLSDSSLHATHARK